MHTLTFIIRIQRIATPQSVELALELERKDEVWERIVSRLNQRIEQLEKELAALKRTHDATHNDLAEKIIEAERAGADAVREAREEMTAEMAARETAAAEREARLQHEITELKEAAEAVAFKTATQVIYKAILCACALQPVTAKAHHKHGVSIVHTISIISRSIHPTHTHRRPLCLCPSSTSSGVDGCSPQEAHGERKGSRGEDCATRG